MFVCLSRHNLSLVSNYKAEAEALKTAAAHIEVSTHASPNVVLFTDALSVLQALQSNRDTEHNHLSAAVLQALQSNRDTELNDLSAVLASLCRGYAVTLQWIPSHCDVPGNEAADTLAMEGTTMEQVDRSTSYPEGKTILKAKQHIKWRHKHPRYNKADPYYLLTRREQVTVFRLRTGHNRLNYQLYSKLCSALVVLAVRQQNIYCSPALSTSHSERESGQTTLPYPASSTEA